MWDAQEFSCALGRERALEAEHQPRQNVNARSKCKDCERLGARSHCGRVWNSSLRNSHEMAWVQEWGGLGTKRARDGLEVTQQGQGSNPGNLLPSSRLSAAQSSLPMPPGGPQALGVPVLRGPRLWGPCSQGPQRGTTFPSLPRGARVRTAASDGALTGGAAAAAAGRARRAIGSWSRQRQLED